MTSYVIDPTVPLPKRWRDGHGPIRIMGEPQEGYVLARRPGCMPFVLTVKQLLNAEKHPHHGPFEGEIKTKLKQNPVSHRGSDKALRSTGSTSAPVTSRGPASEPRGDKSVPAGLVIYCDGACEPNPGVGGWAFVVYRDGAEIHAEHGGEQRTTNNIMEMTGALMALRWFADRQVVEPVRLLCDSQYVVKGCNEWRHGWKRNGWNKRSLTSPKRADGEIKNLDLWKELDEALTLVPITLEWVKGHAGIIGNERADELSLMGRESVLAEPASMRLIREQLDYSARGAV
ncbi:ribonuclease H family protein [Aminobacter niigataensis]|uniref:ribonuclease H family protein n=1 Tax=Aminobacter niigataensis TaxID=83265 RepID=UPI0024CC93C3|nr:ribonuclease H [Aminobacter niigataensis]CAI2936054.1 Ribonuclease HI [Aminobacter niigataensis]